ncbi:MAG TPA: hypothetical protein VFR04_09450 [Solirubrobacterales bacterium]|nr:hypothetical protein [Solirubrobacterales bacterium]
MFSYCNSLPADQLARYRNKEHSLYWKTEQAENNGKAVASALTGRR